MPCGYARRPFCGVSFSYGQVVPPPPVPEATWAQFVARRVVRQKGPVWWRARQELEGPTGWRHARTNLPRGPGDSVTAIRGPHGPETAQDWKAWDKYRRAFIAAATSKWRSRRRLRYRRHRHRLCCPFLLPPLSALGAACSLGGSPLPPPPPQLTRALALASRRGLRPRPVGVKTQIAATTEAKDHGRGLAELRADVEAGKGNGRRKDGNEAVRGRGAPLSPPHRFAVRSAAQGQAAGSGAEVRLPGPGPGVGALSIGAGLTFGGDSARGGRRRSTKARSVTRSVRLAKHREHSPLCVSRAIGPTSPRAIQRPGRRSAGLHLGCMFTGHASSRWPSRMVPMGQA